MNTADKDRARTADRLRLELGRAVRRYRESVLNMDQASFGRSLDVNPATISRIEGGKYRMSSKTLIAITEKYPEIADRLIYLYVKELLDTLGTSLERLTGRDDADSQLLHEMDVELAEIQNKAKALQNAVRERRPKHGRGGD